MPSEQVPQITAILTAVGGADGYVSVASNEGFFPGAFAWLNDGVDMQYVQIAELVGPTKIGIRFWPVSQDDPKLRTGTVTYPNFGRNTCAAFAAGARLTQHSQVAPVKAPGVPFSCWPV